MNKITLAKYYFFGTSMRYLQDVSSGWNIHKTDCLLDNISRFLKQLVEINLTVTRRASFKLVKFKEQLEAEPEIDRIDEEKASELQKIMNDIRLTLDAEMGGIEAFITSPKRYENEKLLSSIHELFAPNIFENFTDIAKYDFNEAGKCIVFERSTSAAFHILRATEANLRHYYKTMVKQKRISSEMWGPIIQDLRIKPKTKKHNALNNHLDNIRISFRNPTQHPEAIYDIHETQDLFAVCIDVNNRMFKLIENV